MSQQYGEFVNSIIKLDDAQAQVKAVWRDGTANSFDRINDNIKLCAEKIWALYSDSSTCVSAVKQNYDADAVDKELCRLAMQVEQV